MREAIALTLTLLAFGCTEEGVGPDRDAIGRGDAPRGEIADASCAVLPCNSDCDEIVCHEYGGGIEECTCVDDGSQPANDLGPGPEPDPDPYAD